MAAGGGGGDDMMLGFKEDDAMRFIFGEDIVGMDDPGAFDRSLMELQVFKEVFCGPTDTPTASEPQPATLAAVPQEHAQPHGPDLDAAAYGFMGYLQPDQHRFPATTTTLEDTPQGVTCNAVGLGSSTTTSAVDDPMPSYMEALAEISQFQSATTLLSDPFLHHWLQDQQHYPSFTYDQDQGDDAAYPLHTTLKDLSDTGGVEQHPFYREQAHGTPALPQQSQFWFSPTQLTETEAICQNGTPDVNVSSLDEIDLLGGSSSVQSGSATAVSKKALGRDIPDQLEAHAHRLFKDAGWTIKPRKRNDRAKMASYFTAPNREVVHTSLTQAWKFCGNKLYEASTDSERGRYPKEWSGVDAFWKDLTDTMAYVDRMLANQQNALTLLQRWQILDPFIAVVFISRKITALQQHKTLRAVNSTTFVLDGSTYMSSETTMDMSATGIINAPEEYGLHSGVDTLKNYMKAESKSEKLYEDDQNNKFGMLLSSEGMQLNMPQTGRRTEVLRDCNTFSETHCIARDPQSDATVSFSDDKAQEKITSSHGQFSEDSQVGPTGNPVLAESSHEHSAAVLETDPTCDSRTCKTATAKMKPKGWEKYMKKRPRELRISDEDLLMTAVVKNKDLVCCHKFAAGFSGAKNFKKLKSHKKCNKLQLKTGKAGTNLLGGKRMVANYFAVTTAHQLIIKLACLLRNFQKVVGTVIIAPVRFVGGQLVKRRFRHSQLFSNVHNVEKHVKLYHPHFSLHCSSPINFSDAVIGEFYLTYFCFCWQTMILALSKRSYLSRVKYVTHGFVGKIVKRVHGTKAAELPFIATSVDYRRQGMCRILMNIIEKMLRSFNVKMLVLSAIPELVSTWVSGFGFKPIEDVERKQLHNVNLMLFPGTSLLTKRFDGFITATKPGDEKDLHEVSGLPNGKFTPNGKSRDHFELHDLDLSGKEFKAEISMSSPFRTLKHECGSGTWFQSTKV
nr:unnamed protein product [Digitaria exilis]